MTPRRSSSMAAAAPMLLLGALLLLSFCTSSCYSLPLTTAADYSFDEYEHDFDKTYATTQEREERKAIFQANLELILQHNNNNLDGGGYTMGVNEWTDRKIPQELPLGYVKKSSTSSMSRVVDGNTDQFLTSSDNEGLFFQQSSPEAEEFLKHWIETSVVPVSELPTEVDWRTHSEPKVTTDVKQQGFCGSCWAVAASEVLESHIALQTGTLYTLSPQEMVSCVQNSEHCGGDGGCGGATYELAFDYVMQHGIVSEKDFPYKSGHGKKVECSLEEEEQQQPFVLRGTISHPNIDNHHHHENGGYIEDAVATVQGYVNFPTNNYTMLMNAVANLGPIGVTVAASKWSFYSGGVFDDKGDHHSTGATDVNHAVVLEGYGIDQETQEPYWLIRNSWGKTWGEGGYIRLKRVDPSSVPDGWEEAECGIDQTPSDGAGCTKDKDGNDIVPPPVKVCGTSAVLYDTFVPFGGRLLQPSHTSLTAQQES